jgi:hypothetical protein
MMIVGLACSGSPTGPSPTPVTLSLASEAWQTISDPQPFPLANAGPDLTFDFPIDGSMHYLFTPSPLSIVRGTLSATFRVTVVGQVIFNPLDTTNCSLPPSVRPFLWANDNGNGNYDRWWSNPRSYPLAAGSTTLSVPLTADAWSSVNGRFGNADAETRFGFDKALVNLTRLGLTFGGGCSFGHGINIRGGAASFALTDYTIR